MGIKLRQENYDDTIQTLTVWINGESHEEKRKWDDPYHEWFCLCRDQKVSDELIYKVLCKTTILLNTTKTKEKTEFIKRESHRAKGFRSYAQCLGILPWSYQNETICNLQTPYSVRGVP